ncbi:hypothetical protein [Calothrix sp. NIES-3974]|nr:hypothetical protein [Calothrix sp. NIES-3974]
MRNLGTAIATTLEPRGVNTPTFPLAPMFRVGEESVRLLPRE